MSTEIKKFDANEAMLSVKEKIKDSFVSLIPDDQWNEMVKKEVDGFFQVRDEGYGERVRSSSFTKEVHAVLTTEVHTRVKEYLSANFQSTWFDNGIPKCNAMVEDMIVKNSGKILADMIGGTMQNALSSAGYRM